MPVSRRQTKFTPYRNAIAAIVEEDTKVIYYQKELEQITQDVNKLQRLLVELNKKELKVRKNAGSSSLEWKLWNEIWSEQMKTRQKLGELVRLQASRRSLVRIAEELATRRAKRNLNKILNEPKVMKF